MSGVGGSESGPAATIVAFDPGRDGRRRAGTPPATQSLAGSDAVNDAIARRNRAWLAERRVLMLDLVSAPGAGKTALLERMVREFGPERPLSVVEGGQATTLDGDRIRAVGGRVVQLDTQTLAAEQVGEALAMLDPPAGSVVAIENPGSDTRNLGEWAKVALLSVTEGEDKPLKYPHLFRAARLMLLNKIDLLPHLRFDEARAVANALAVNPDIHILPVSAATGKGLACLYRSVRQWADEACGPAAGRGQAGWPA